MRICANTIPVFTKKSLSLKNWRQGLSKWDGVFFATWSEEGPQTRADADEAGRHFLPA